MNDSWKAYKPFMSQSAIDYMEQKTMLYNTINAERDKEKLIQEILKRIEVDIENKAQKPLEELESIMARIFK